MERYVIAGGGPAGIAAARAIRERDENGEIVVVSRETVPLYYRTDLDLFIGGRMTREQLVVHPPELYREQRIDVRLGQTIESVHSDENGVQLDDGSGLEYGKLLVATGASPIMGNWPGADLDGVVTIRTAEDAEALVARFDRLPRTAVIGGGLVGLITAEALRRRKLEVCLLVREATLWWPVLDSPASEILRRRLESEGVEVRTEEEVAEFVGQEKLEGLRTSKGSLLPLDIAIVAIGVRPNVQLLRNSTVKTDRGVLVNEYLQSSVPKVYAAGDVAQAYDIVQRAHRVNTSWDNAERQGQVAGSNMASGNSRRYAGGLAANTEVVYGIPFTALGLVSPPAEGYESLTQAPKENVYRRLVVKDGRLVGALIVGRTRQAARLQKLIEEQENIGAIKEQLLGEG